MSGDEDTGVTGSLQGWLRAGVQAIAGRSSVFIPLLTLNAFVWAALGVSTLRSPIEKFHYFLLIGCFVMLLGTVKVYLILLIAKPELLRSDHYQVIDRMGQQMEVFFPSSKDDSAWTSTAEVVRSAPRPTESGRVEGREKAMEDANEVRTKE